MNLHAVDIECGAGACGLATDKKKQARQGKNVRQQGQTSQNKSKLLAKESFQCIPAPATAKSIATVSRANT
jgi:hypothetical protein